MRPFAIRLRRLLGELHYAQRRALELRTGVALTGSRPPSRAAGRGVSELEALWRLPTGVAPGTHPGLGPTPAEEPPAGVPGCGAG